MNTHTCHAIKANSSLEKQCNVHPLPFSDARLKGITAQRNFGAYRSSNSTRRAAHSVPRTWPGRGSGGNTRKQGDAMNEGHFFLVHRASCYCYTISPRSPLESRLDGVPGRPGKSQKEGQKNQRTFKSLGAIPPLLFHLSLVLLPFLLALPWPPRTPSNELKKSPA